MTQRSDVWQRVREIFEGALALPVERRPSFVAAACGSDAGLRAQIDGLLASHDSAKSFLEGMPLGLLDPDPVANLEGRRVGPYLIQSRVGAGGMGEVYRAYDTRLNRQIAIKVLPVSAAGDTEARARFEREGRAVAALSHPHICTLYDVGHDEDIDYLVMEYLDGETLAARQTRGPLSLAQAVQSAIQIASALDHAHRSGIVHRDLKPANVMLTASGAKLLDFGLAKPPAFAAPPGSVAGRSGSDLTAPGAILGTLNYMAPEQLEGLPADARTDLFAFGCVFYEMLAGRKAFDGHSSAGVVTAIMSLEPAPIAELQPLAPPSVDYVIARCLAKSRDDRWQTATDLLAELRRIGDSPKPSVPTTPVRHAVSRLWPALAAATFAAVVIAAGFAMFARPPAADGRATWLSILPPPNGFDLSPDPIVSPDGRYVAFKAEDTSHQTQIWLKTLGSPQLTQIPGTDGTLFTAAPFWSPDSRSIGFFAQGKLKRVEVGGGNPQVIAAAPEPRGGTWTTTGVIIFNGDAHSLYRVPATGAPSATVMHEKSEPARLFPHALPDGKHYLFTSRNANGLGQGVYVAALDSSEVKRISDAWSPAVYANGHLLFVREHTLFAQPFDLSRLTLNGEPQRVTDGIGLGFGNPLSFSFSVSTTGVISYWSGTATAHTQLTWFDRSGTKIAAVGETENQAGLALSADGRRVALERGDRVASTVDLWLLDTANAGRAARLTFDGRPATPVMSSDGSRVLFMQRGHGLVIKDVAGGRETAITQSLVTQWSTDWSVDGRYVAWGETTPEGYRLMTAPADGTHAPAVYREGSFRLMMLQFSPDGRWVAYESEEAGERDVYVDSYPAPSNKIRVSSAGGGRPKWRRDGKELYYLAPDRKVMAVEVRVENGSLRTSSPIALFEGPATAQDGSRSQFAPNADGSRFLFNARVDDRTPVGLTVLSNWLSLVSGR